MVLMRVRLPHESNACGVHSCRAWRKLIGDQDLNTSIIACIGSTTAVAAEKQGFTHIYFPEQPGIDGFVAAIKDGLEFACQQIATTRT